VAAVPEVDLAFEEPLVLSEGAELALEDYARALVQAGGAEALRSPDNPGVVRGVRLRGPALALSPALVRDVQDFARGLTLGRGGPGLGWS
jgi:hypothetical protein